MFLTDLNLYPNPDLESDIDAVAYPGSHNNFNPDPALDPDWDPDPDPGPEPIPADSSQTGCWEPLAQILIATPISVVNLQ